MAEDLKDRAELEAEIERHIDYLNKAEAAALRLWHAMNATTDDRERARLSAMRTIELDVSRSHWAWLYTHGIDFKHLDRVGMKWKPYEVIDLVALMEQELAAKAADRERMRAAARRAIIASASQ